MEGTKRKHFNSQSKNLCAQRLLGCQRCERIDDYDDMVQCDYCDDWYHFRCAGVSKKIANLELFGQELFRNHLHSTNEREGNEL